MLSTATLSTPVRYGTLDRFVEQIQVVRREPGETNRSVELLPDGTTNLVFRRLGDAADVTVRGPGTRAHYKTAPAIPLYVRVVFRPGGAYPFFGVPVDQLTDRYVTLGDLWGRSGELLQERLIAAADDGGDVAEIMRRALVDRLRTTPFEPSSAVAARAAVGLLARGERSVAEVAGALGLSERHLRRAFQATVGLTPKTFARIARFQRALALGRAAPGRWNEVALATGYFDQAHLIAEFQRLALVSPSALAAPTRRPRRACG
ncbi:MAG: helix-turn-helix transcriptional regulator [Minicystis sp.]